MTTVVPTVYVGLPSTLYSVTLMPEPPPSFGVRVTVTALDCQPLGALSVVTGFVLSTRLVTKDDVVEFPAASVAITCRSTLPSGAAVLSKLAPVDCQEPPPLVEYSYATLTTPEAFAPPGSLVEDVRLTEPRRYGPGLLIVASGGVLSTSRSVTGVAAAWFPATS